MTTSSPSSPAVTAARQGPCESRPRQHRPKDHHAYPRQRHQRREAIKRRDAGEPTREIARMFNVSHSTISRLST
ncbi:MAG: helix-turn-helix domain-containing protein [Methylocystis sp.]